MRKIISLLLACFLIMGSGALAQSAGNLNNGGFVTSLDGVLFASTGKGIVRVDESGAKTIVEDNAFMLQTDGDRLYYLVRAFDDEKYGYSEEISRTPMSCALDGSDQKILGDSRTLSVETDYESYSYDTYVGYGDFTLYNGRLYYLANGDVGGEYDCNAIYSDENDQAHTQTQTVTYANGISLFSMALDGSDQKEIIKNIGNGICHFAIADDKIYLASSFADMLYAYYYTNFGVYDLEGKLIKQYPGYPDGENSFFSESGKYYAIIDGCQVYAGSLYMGFQQSEGDFRSSSLCEMLDSGDTRDELMQDSMIPSVIDGDEVYYVGSASDELIYVDGFDYQDSLGIYVKKIGTEGLGTKLAKLDDDTVYETAINVVDGNVYYKTGEGEIYKVPAEGGEAELIINN